jgi:hypothetical protein
MNEEKKMSLRDTIVPKSDQLNFDDLVTGPITVKVKGLAMGEGEQPVIVKLEGGLRDYKPCKSMRRVLIACWGDKGKDWIGKSMTLYGDPKVVWGGVAIGGIRISHVSGIEKPVNVMLSMSKSKREPCVIKPLVVTDAQEAETLI